MKNPTLFLSNFSIAVSLVAGISNWKYFNRLFKLVMLYLLSGLIAQVIGGILVHTYKSNTIVFNCYVFAELIIVTSIALQMAEGRTLKQLIYLGAFACLMIDVFYVSKYGLFVYANWGHISACLLFIITYVYIMVNLLTSRDAHMLSIQPRFWVCLGVLIYYGGTVPIMGFFHYLWNYHRSIAEKIYNINDLLTVLYCSLFIVAMVQQRKISKKQALNNLIA